MIASEPMTGRSRLLWIDVLRVGFGGLTTRRLRSALSALGISIGVAALVAVLGLSESSRADLIEQIEALGTNLLVVESGAGFGAGDASLPADAADRVARIPSVETTAATYPVDANAYRNDYMSPDETNALSVRAADLELLDTLAGSMADGRFLDEATSAYPAAVLGSVAAERLGVTDLDERAFIVVAPGDATGEGSSDSAGIVGSNGAVVEVIGILDEFPLAADLDRSVLIGVEAAETYFGAGDTGDAADTAATPDAVYARVGSGSLDQTRDLVSGTADPENPEEVTVSRPSDVLEAQAAAESAFTDLFLGLGAVALLVGAIGITNVMVIAVIERRGEIGLRRSIGASRGHIRRQFITESALLSGAGGLIGVAVGAALTAVYATSRGWRIILPTEVMAGGLVAAIVIGVIAGLYPAMRAARLSPTEALRT